MRQTPVMCQAPASSGPWLPPRLSSSVPPGPTRICRDSGVMPKARRSWQLPFRLAAPLPRGAKCRLVAQPRQQGREHSGLEF